MTVYNEAAGTDLSMIDLDSTQTFLLAKFIYGDLVFRMPPRTEAMAYSTAGAKVYVLYFDMDTERNLFSSEASCCGVAHASELFNTFGWIHPYAADTLPWELEVSDYIIDQISSIVKTGTISYPSSHSYY